MIAVVAPAGELRDAVVAALGPDVRVAEPGDPAALARTLEGVERMFLACEDPVAAGDVVAAAEMALVYHCVTVHEVPALDGSALRSTVLLAGDAPRPAPDELAALAARALRDDPPPP